MWWEQLNFIYLILLLLTIAVILLGLYLIRVVNHYKKLTRGVNNQSLDKILETIINKQNSHAAHLSDLSAHQVTQEEKSREYFQKYALIRFNPFEDAGGDQSFVVALLDGRGNGIVISSLHSRSGTRVYTKGVTAGKPQVHAFTKEEKEAVEKALKKKNI